MKKYYTQIILLVSIIACFIGIIIFINCTKEQEEKEKLEITYDYLQFINYNDYEAILKKSGDYLVVFVNTGCDYCELYKPLINSYAMKENSLNVYVLDFSILEKSELAEVLASQEYLATDTTWGFPLTMYFRDGKMIDKLKGLKVIEDIEELVIKNKK